MTGAEYVQRISGAIGLQPCIATCTGSANFGSGDARLHVESSTGALGGLVWLVPALSVLAAAVSVRVDDACDSKVEQSRYTVSQGYVAIRRTDGSRLAELRFTVVNRHAQIEVHSDLQPSGHIARLEDFVVVLVPTGRDRIAVTAEFRVVLDDGASATGIVFCPVTSLDSCRGLSGIQLDSASVLEQNWADTGCVVTTRSSIEPVVPGRAADHRGS